MEPNQERTRYVIWDITKKEKGEDEILFPRILDSTERNENYGGRIFFKTGR